VYREIWGYAGFLDVMGFANGSLLAGKFLLLILPLYKLEISSSIVVLYLILSGNCLIPSRFPSIRFAEEWLGWQSRRTAL